MAGLDYQYFLEKRGTTVGGMFLGGRLTAMKKRIKIPGASQKGVKEMEFERTVDS